MEANKKFKTSNVAVCLKAIKEYVDMDETKVTKKEKGQLKERAKNALDHLDTIFKPVEKNVMMNLCPSEGLPTI